LFENSEKFRPNDALFDWYHPDTNPEGYINMLNSGNRLMQKELIDKIKDIHANHTIPGWVTEYTRNTGHPIFKTAIAKYMKNTWIHQAPIDPDFIACQAGGGTLLEELGFCLCDDGDTLLTPEPIYFGFDHFFDVRNNLRIGKIKTIPERRYIPIEEELDAAYDESICEGSTPKILLLTNPCNPTGVVYPKETMEMCIDWA